MRFLTLRLRIVAACLLFAATVACDSGDSDEPRQACETINDCTRIEECVDGYCTPISGPGGDAGQFVGPQVDPDTICFSPEGRDERCVDVSNANVRRTVRNGNVYIAAEFDDGEFNQLEHCCASQTIHRTLRFSFPEGAPIPYRGDNLTFDMEPFTPRVCERGACDSRPNSRPTSLVNVVTADVEVESADVTSIVGHGVVVSELYSSVARECPYLSCNFIEVGETSVRFHLRF